MAISVGDALLKVGIDTKGAMSELESFGSKIKATGQSISKVSTPFLVAGGAITGTLTAMVIKAANTGDAFNDMSLRTGVSVENLSRLKYAADLSGISIDGVETSLKFLTKAMVSAQDDTSKTGETFKNLGVSATDSNGQLRPTVDVMKELATKIAAIKNPTEQASIAMELFGARSGTELLPLLKEGGNGIDELMKKADDLGITISTKTAKAGDEFNDTLTTLKSSLGGVSTTLGTTLMPVIMDFINKHILPLIEKLKEIPIETLTRDIEILAGVGGILLLVGAIGKVIGIVTSLGSKISLLFSFPTGLIIAGIALAILGIIELVEHWDSIKAAMTGFYEKWIEPWLGKLIKGLEWVIDLFEKIGSWFKKGMNKISVAFSGTVNPLEAGGHLQGGGIVTRPGVYSLAERGPEAVIPLNGMSNDESLRIQKDMLKELKKFNEFTSKKIARDISLGIAGLGQKA